MLEYYLHIERGRAWLTGLRTADSGYLTRRLVDVAQDVIVREDDCGTDTGIDVAAIVEGDTVIESLAERITGRVSLQELVDEETGEVIVAINRVISEDQADEIERRGSRSWSVRSVLKCRTRHGVCVSIWPEPCNRQPCRSGRSRQDDCRAVHWKPGTQLTMRTFHTGGVAGDDITRGLPRVEELFEARKPRALP